MSKLPLWRKAFIQVKSDHGRLQGRPGICYIDESTTSHTYNFWLSNLSSPPEGFILVAIPVTQLGVTYLNPLIYIFPAKSSLYHWYSPLLHKSVKASSGCL